ncbi:MAG: SpoVG family protein [Acetatifactor sp.]
MKYSIKLNAVNNPDKNVKAFATVTFGDCFKITNIAVVKSQEEPFVSMPSFKSKERTEHNQPVYKDVCNPITSEFRKKLYDDILSLYAEMEQSGKTEVSRYAENAQEPEFRVAVTPFEREGSNIRGLARIYFEDCFVVSNVSIIQGKEKEFVAMPSYMVKQNGGKSQYQDVCFPVTKEFREKLYDALMDCYQQERDKAMNQGMEQATSQSMERAESRQPDRNLPFR